MSEDGETATTPEEGGHLPSKEQVKFYIEPTRFSRGKNNPLPPRPRPKLHPFRPFGIVDDIEWIHEVAVTEMSAVWKVKIDGDFYALKLFGFPLLSDVCMPTYCSTEYLRSYFLHQDAFHSECRAYGRLKETGHGHLVVPCHGYVFLTAAQEHTVRDLSSRLPYGLLRLTWFNQFPLRGLIKDWIDSPEYFTPSMIPRMIRDIKTINSLGIINRDIKMNNFLGGKQFDFGLAWTVPHFELDHLLEEVRTASQENNARIIHFAKERLHSELEADLWKFDRMIDEWNECDHLPRIWTRIRPNFEYLKKLRPVGPFERNWEAYTGPNPLKYNWKRNSKQRPRQGRILKDPSKRRKVTVLKNETRWVKKVNESCTVL